MKSLEVKHCQMDLNEFIEGLRGRLHRIVEAVKKENRELTPVENARFEVGWGLLHDLLMDLDGIKNSWEAGHGAYRKTEKELGHEE